MKTITATIATFTAIALAGCETLNLPKTAIPDAPKECEQVLSFSVPPYPSGKTNTAQLSVWATQDAINRRKEQEAAQVCAKDRLRVSGVLSEKTAAPGVVDPATVKVGKDGSVGTPSGGGGKRDRPAKRADPEADPFTGS